MAKKKAQTLTAEKRLEQALVPESEQPYAVPENWVWTRLEHIGEIVTGGTPSKKNDAYYSGSFPFFKPADLDHGRHVFSASEYLSDKGKSTCRVVPKWSTAVCCIGTIGKCGFLLQEGTTNQQINTVIPRFEPLFVYYYCRTELFLQQLLSMVSATTISIVNKGKMSKCMFPLPPFAEQQRIVARIEGLFEKLDHARELIQSALDSFETRKAAILHKAFMGELTAQWREENGVGMESWRHVRLVDVIIERPRNGYSPVGVSHETNIKNLTLSATTSGLFRFDCFKYVDVKIEKDSYLWLQGEDILIQRANSIDHVGVSAVVSGNVLGYIYPDLMMKVRANKNLVLTDYLQYVLSSKDSRDYFRKNATGTAGNMPKINQTVVSNLPIFLPTLSEQQEIGRILNEVLEKEQKAKEQLEPVLDQIDLMKKSILARAFRGELGTNDPGEEDAVELLKEVLRGTTKRLAI